MERKRKPGGAGLAQKSKREPSWHSASTSGTRSPTRNGTFSRRWSPGTTLRIGRPAQRSTCHAQRHSVDSSRTGAPCARSAKPRLGPWQTVYDHFRKWAQGGHLWPASSKHCISASTRRARSTGTSGVLTAHRSAPPGLRPGLTKKSQTPRKRAKRPRAGPLARRIHKQVPPGY